ncbi:hypothetical protein [Desulfospira joergensenii]|uniref:hypothetical protein n=1 Tax=Desulfospira joergensenii TaxID=53329 RepID=UPI0003B73C7C|nr:hypothetical protein [Desulfospira joergensenii]
MKIAAYGFEIKGFQIPDGHIIENDKTKVSFLPISTEETLDSYTGVILPSGIFESFEERSSYIDGRYVNVHCKRDTLLQREREIINLVNKGGWICCLVDSIVDEVPNGGYSKKSCDDTDMVKKLLNSFDIKRSVFKGTALVKSTNDAFKKYIDRYGVAKTILKIPYRENYDKKILAKSGEAIVGIDLLGNFLFLPFHTTNYSQKNCEELLLELISAISDYLQKRIQEIPEWVSEFEFQEEDRLKEKINSLMKDITNIQKELKQYRNYKGILTQSGDTLKDTVVDLLRSFFALNVTDVEDFKEDAMIRDNEGKAIVIVEIKGTKGGIKRKYINQLDSNRERAGLDPSTPGLLIINDQMSVENVSERRETSVAEEQVNHSKNMNVILLRTVDLLFVVRKFENIENKRDEFLKLCSEGGGRLTFDDESSMILK